MDELQPVFKNGSGAGPSIRFDEYEHLCGVRVGCLLLCRSEPGLKDSNIELRLLEESHVSCVRGATFVTCEGAMGAAAVGLFANPESQEPSMWFQLFRARNVPPRAPLS